MSVWSPWNQVIDENSSRLENAKKVTFFFAFDFFVYIWFINL